MQERAGFCSNRGFRDNRGRIVYQNWVGFCLPGIGRRPEPRGIGSQHLVNQNELTIKLTKLEFRIGDDDATLAGVISREVINFEACCSRAFRDVGAYDVGGLFERNVLVMPCFGFGAGVKIGSGSSDDSLRPAGNLIPQTVWFWRYSFQPEPARYPAHDTFDRERFGFFDDHTAAGQLVA
jgi:hypothetical protein